MTESTSNTVIMLDKMNKYDADSDSALYVKIAKVYCVFLSLSMYNHVNTIWRKNIFST